MTVTATALASVSLPSLAQAQFSAPSGTQPGQLAPGQLAPGQLVPGQLAPVQPIRSTPQPLARSQAPAQKAAAISDGSWNLRWKSSSQVAPAAATPAAATPAAAPAVARVAYLQDADPFLDPFNDGTASQDPRPQIPNPFSPGETAEPEETAPSPSDQQRVVPEPQGGPLRDRSERAIDSSASPQQRVEPSCDELRQRIAQRTIRKVSLDISPPFRPDILEQDEYAERRAEFLEEQEQREWRSLDGRLLAQGRLIDLAFENAIVETEQGQEIEISMAELSEPDLEYVTSAWGLPRECQLPQVAFQPRQWLPTKMTWKASELCHKPLYFEEVNLERYGHTAGPFAQPVVSTAHFFFNIAVLPYKMGIHPPNECQYALGYYRPGNCAPWIVPPVPLSLRGALAETAFVGGMVALVP